MSFEWGKFPHEIEQGLSERDLTMMLQYAARHMLPKRRQAVQLARVCQVVSNGQTKLQDHLFDYVRPTPDVADNVPEGAREISSMTGSGFRIIGRKLKRQKVH